ncbi:hypothetical protein [Microbulbifer variabilis]|uniref:hypothetical protein n=1 Tax=Microbulbifer variabilis TaxID=266805 RepID=UPI001CFD98AA|nr:hypothetical protein [Microbulbifer variabilis]
MDSEIYERAKDLACSLVNASGAGDTKEYWSLHHELEALCRDNEVGERNHPFQWEALADFTTDDGASIEIYEKAFALAENMGLSDYMASIKFALAERYRSLNLAELAHSCAEAANEYAKNSCDLELRKEISEFLLDE